MKNLNPIRILHVVGAMNIAGTETMLMNIYRNIDSGVHFDFISYCKMEAAYDEEIEKIGGKVIKLSNTQSIKELYDAIKKNGPYNVVHSHTMFHCGIANIAAKLAGVKIRISHAHTTLDKSDSYIRKVYMKSMQCIINAFSTKLLACSNEAGKYLFGERHLHKSKFIFFPNLIEYQKFFKVQRKEIDKFKAEERLENSIIIGHIGRFIEAKNHMFLLDVLKNLIKKNKKVKLLLVGDGELKPQVVKAAKSQGIYSNIRFLGLRSDIPLVLHSMDLFVFPSIHEGLGLVLLEAQASGLPCVVSDAIQPEADLSLNLVSRLSLADGVDAWADKIIELAGKKEKNVNKIIQGFETNGYALSVGIAKLKDIYNIPAEGT